MLKLVRIRPFEAPFRCYVNLKIIKAGMARMKWSGYRETMPKIFLILGWLYFGCATGVTGQESISPPAAFDLQGFVDAQVRSGKHNIRVPPGRYRVTPRDRRHLILHDLNDVQIIADGVEMICTETTRAVTVTRCTNLTLRGLVIDYDPLPFTEGRIIALSDDKKVHDIELFEGYPEAGAATKFKYEIFRPDTRTLRCGDRYPSKIEVRGPRLVRLFIPNGRADNPEQVGDLVVMGAEFAPHGSLPHAVECDHCVNVKFENIDLYASNSFGFLEYGCSATTYYRCRIQRRGRADDYMNRADARLRSLNADAFHSSGAVKGPSYIECTAKFMGDDCINIHGDYHLVMTAQGNQLRVLAKGALANVEGDMDIQPGDPVELVDFDGRRRPDARVVSMRASGLINEDERAFLSRIDMNPNLKSAHHSLTRAYTIVLNTSVKMSTGSVICAANRTGQGFSVKNCDFGFNRSRGILIKASDGEITGNHIESSRMSAILVAPEYWWLESGTSTNVKINGNTISNCLGIPICVEAMAGNGEIAPAGAHKNIGITDNLIENCAAPGILVTSTTDLSITNNNFRQLAESSQLPARMLQAGLKSSQPIVEINCELEAGPDGR